MQVVEYSAAISLPELVSCSKTVIRIEHLKILNLHKETYELDPIFNYWFPSLLLQSLKQAYYLVNATFGVGSALVSDCCRADCHAYSLDDVTYDNFERGLRAQSRGMMPHALSCRVLSINQRIRPIPRWWLNEVKIGLDERACRCMGEGSPHHRCYSARWDAMISEIVSSKSTWFEMETNCD